MNSKLKTIATAAVCTVITASAVYIGFAADPGSQDDPIVTKSYVEKAVKEALADYIKSSDIQSAIDANSSVKAANETASSAVSKAESASSAAESAGGAASQAQQTADEAVSAASEAQTDADTANSGVSSNATEIGIAKNDIDLIKGKVEKFGYKSVTLARNKTLSASVGTEIIVRSGVASCSSPSSDTGIFDFTSGKFCPNGTRLENEHYFVFEKTGRGIYASADCELLVRGEYSIN